MALTRSGMMRAFFRDVRAGTCRASEMIRLTVGSAFRKALYAMRGEGLSGENKTTPTEVLGLQPGEWVEVKSAPKIVATVDRRGRNRGLQFSGEMLAFCGKCLRVRNSLSSVRRQNNSHKTAVLLRDGSQVIPLQSSSSRSDARPEFAA